MAFELEAEKHCSVLLQQAFSDCILIELAIFNARPSVEQQLFHGNGIEIVETMAKRANEKRKFPLENVNRNHSQTMLYKAFVFQIRI